MRASGHTVRCGGMESEPPDGAPEEAAPHQTHDARNEDRSGKMGKGTIPAIRRGEPRNPAVLGRRQQRGTNPVSQIRMIRDPTASASRPTPSSPLGPCRIGAEAHRKERKTLTCMCWQTGPGRAIRRPINLPRMRRPGPSIYQCCDIADDGPRRQDAATAAATLPVPPAFLAAVRSSPQSDLPDYGRRVQR